VGSLVVIDSTTPERQVLAKLSRIIKKLHPKIGGEDYQDLLDQCLETYYIAGSNMRAATIGDIMVELFKEDIDNA